MSVVEVELKLQVPAQARERVRRAVATATAVRTRLRAVYADTADQRLAAAGFALRLRQEGRRWVQTLKGRGEGLLERFEHEVELPAQRGTPWFDVARHAGTAGGDALATLLADGAPLEERYRTDIVRLHRRLRAGAATIEIAFDEGHIGAGERRVEVGELEFELVAGPAQALPGLAARWVARFGLVIDVRTKSERGHRLALGLDRVPAVKAAPSALPERATPGMAFAAIVQNALAQVLANAAEVAADAGAAETLHQLRVGLRRLRTALRLFGAWSADPLAAQAFEERLREPFAALGGARDIDAMAEWLGPELVAAGAPRLVWPVAGVAGPEPGEVVRARGFNALMLEVLGFALDSSAQRSDLVLADAAGQVIRRAWRAVRRDADRFAEATPDERHLLRRRLKRLRYGCEFVQALLPAKAARRALAAQRKALEDLGRCNDIEVAQAIWRSQADDDPHAWFVLGWLAAAQAPALRRATRRVGKVKALKRFWR